MSTTKRFGRAIASKSSCATTRSVRSLEWFDSYVEATKGVYAENSGTLIIDIKKPCRICGEKYYSDIHLVDGRAYDFSDWKVGDKRHWFID
jgi:hypothetical protein